MDKTAEPGLLPQGARDILPPDAAFEAAMVERLMACFAERGYERVKPPLIEFEESFLGAAGADVARQTFRLMDPVSRRMLVLRSDITPQIARIAATRLGAAPRPLRLSYAGQVLQVAASQLRPERQIGQAGIELIGPGSPEADAEVVTLAAEALAGLGVGGLAVDLNLPTLVAAVAAELGLDAGRVAQLRAALDRKDEAAVPALAGPDSATFVALLRAFGPADEAMARLHAVKLPERAAAERARLAAVIAIVTSRYPDLAVTVDPVEHRGFEYQSGISFILFARGLRGELGRGGRYRTAAGEDATGFTLYTDSLLQAVPPPRPQRRLYLADEVPPSRAEALRREGWITLASLAAAAPPLAEARRLGCSHALVGGEIRAVGP
jgi:ATP phosphoribosyltransferase regulatory subunit